MRKQTKLVAVLSTAALLAIGASMTSFAATGWVEEDGTWVYYNRDEDRVTDEWRRSGDNWYYLDSDGEMAVDQLIEDDDDYYYVNESGAMVTNQWVAIENEDAGDEDEPDSYWYYFQANGKAYKRPDSASEDAISARTINGERYGFDRYGRMIASLSDSEASQNNATYSSSFRYFNNPEDGARVTRGWFRVVPGYYLEEDEYNDGSDYWYYADGNGYLYSNEIRSINGRRYAFNENGRMLDGLVLLQMEERENSTSENPRYDSTDIYQKWDDDSQYNYETEDDFDELVKDYAKEFSTGQFRFYYFGDEDDGSMKTGRQTVELDGEDYTFNFRDSSSRGQGIHGIDDHKIYAGGKLIEADSDDRYQIVVYTVSNEDGVEVTTMEKMDTDDFLDEYCYEVTDEDDPDYDEDETLWRVRSTDNEEDADGKEVHFYLVNTSGSMVRNSSSSKDGDDYKFEVDDYEIVSVTLED